MSIKISFGFHHFFGRKNEDTQTVSTPAQTKTNKKWGAILNLRQGTTGFMAGPLKNQLKRDKEQAAIVVTELLSSGLADEFVASYIALCQPSKGFPDIRAAAENAKNQVAVKYGIDPSIAGIVVNKLQDPATHENAQSSRTSREPDPTGPTRNVKTTRRVTFQLPGVPSAQSSASSSAVHMSADQKDILRQIYDAMGGNNYPINAMILAKDRFEEIFTDVPSPEIDRQLNRLKEGMQSASSQVGPNAPAWGNNNAAGSSANHSTGQLSTDEIDALRVIYQDTRLQHDPLMARLNTKIQFFISRGRASEAIVAAVNQQLDKLREEDVMLARLDLNRDLQNANAPVRNSKTDGSLRSSEKTQIINEIYSAIRTDYPDLPAAMARPYAAMKFKEMFPRDTTYLQDQDLSALSTVIPGRRQGEIVVSDRTRVYCGEASPLPVNPGQPFYREKQITGACSQHSLNALVGFNAFDMQYIEKVKCDVLAKTLGMSIDQVKAMEPAESGDTGHDPEILAECLRRKAQAGEIDPKWKNAIANVSVEVNDALWSQLEQRKLNGLIIGRSDNSHYVTQRTDSSGQDRILNSLKTQEINMTTRQYIESLLHEMPATQNGKKTLHFITCPPVARTVIRNT